MDSSNSSSDNPDETIIYEDNFGIEADVSVSMFFGMGDKKGKRIKKENKKSKKKSIKESLIFVTEGQEQVSSREVS